jgi:hypothetical protein
MPGVSVAIHRAIRKPTQCAGQANLGTGHVHPPYSLAALDLASGARTTLSTTMNDLSQTVYAVTVR